MSSTQAQVRERAEQALEQSKNSGYVESGPSERVVFTVLDDAFDSSLMNRMGASGFKFCRAQHIEENGEGKQKVMFLYRRENET